MNLAEIQFAFQAGVLAGEEPGNAAIIASIRDSRRTDRATLFGVYVDAYRLRLAEFISSDFPTLRCHMGDEAFGELVEDYILSGPSRQRNARWYASRLPEFMRETPPWRMKRSACDLALFERTLADVFDAPDARALAIDTLGNVGTEDWPQLVFGFHPSVRLLDLLRGTARIYETVAGGGGRPEIGQSEETVLFWRSEGESFYRRIDEVERLALFEARMGKTFGEVCTLLAFQRDDDARMQRAAGLLQQWFSDGLIVRASVS